jgi:hypothetical protein
VAIGRQAILAGYTVLFVPAPTPVAQLAKAHSEGRLEESTWISLQERVVTQETGEEVSRGLRAAQARALREHGIDPSSTSVGRAIVIRHCISSPLAA